MRMRSSLGSPTTTTSTAPRLSDDTPDTPAAPWRARPTHYDMDMKYVRIGVMNEQQVY